MRKLGLSVLALISAFALAGCTGSSSEKKESVDYTKVLKDETNNGWVIHGQNVLADGTDNGWNGKTKELYEKSKMTAISINDAAAIDSAVGEKLKAKNVEYLYKYEGYMLGKTAVGWNTNYESGSDLYSIDGTYAFKAATVSYDADDEVYSEVQWIPDPKTAHAEALTENLYIPPWTETPNKNGLSWSSNQVVTSGAGVYTIIVAQYKENSTADVSGYGIAVVKTAEAGSDWAKPTATKVEAFIASEHTYGVIGGFPASESWTKDAPMTANATNTEWTADIVTEAANTEIKVRADGAWDVAWGYDALDTDSKKLTSGKEGDNIVLTEAGTYTVTLKNVTVTRGATITLAKKTA